jgi:hypothetical protein
MLFISLIGLSRLIKIGRREIKIKNPGACHFAKAKPKKTPNTKDKIVPIEAVQIKVKIIQGITIIKRKTGENPITAPTKVAKPLPPLPFTKIDQLCPKIAQIPAKA